MFELFHRSVCIRDGERMIIDEVDFGFLSVVADEVVLIIGIIICIVTSSVFVNISVGNHVSVTIEQQDEEVVELLPVYVLFPFRHDAVGIVGIKEGGTRSRCRLSESDAQVDALGGVGRLFFLRATHQQRGECKDDVDIS